MPNSFLLRLMPKKSKCIWFVSQGKTAIANKPELCISGKPTDYVSNGSHLGYLGNILNDEQDDSSTFL